MSPVDPRVTASEADQVVPRLWRALREVEDPEIPVSVVDMGLIVTVDYDADARAANVTITYTAMGCPAMEMIQDDLRQRLLREPGVDTVNVDVVWDPVWTRARLSASARALLPPPNSGCGSTSAKSHRCSADAAACAESGSPPSSTSLE